MRTTAWQGLAPAGHLTDIVLHFTRFLFTPGKRSSLGSLESPGSDSWIKIN